MGQALGPICISSIPRGNQPRIDGCATQVEKWGESRHGGVAIRMRRRCAVITIRGTRPVSWNWIVMPRIRFRQWIHRNDPKPVGGTANGVR